VQAGGRRAEAPASDPLEWCPLAASPFPVPRVSSVTADDLGSQ